MHSSKKQGAAAVSSLLPFGANAAFMMRHLLLPALLLLAATAAVRPVRAETPIDVDFESADPAPADADLMARLFGELEWSNLGGRAKIVAGGVSPGKRALRVAYPAGAIGSAHSGAQFVAKLPRSREYTLTYRLCFSGDFPFTRGGKLPGLSSGGSRYTGGRKPPTGGGWSARYMWRKGGELELYLYHPRMKGPYGERHALKTKIQPGRWHKLTQHIQVNDPGQANGAIAIRIDGKERLKLNNLQLQGPQRGQIDSLLFSTFFGGSTPNWAPEKDCAILFDDFRVMTDWPAQ